MNNIRCEHRIYSDTPNTHSHPYAQLILPLHGILDIETDNCRLAVEEDHLFFIPPACRHTFCSGMHNEFLVLDISSRLLGKQDMAKLAGGKTMIMDDKWKALRYLLLNEAADSSISNAINDLFLYCYHLITDDDFPSSVRFINKHFTEDIDIRILAEIEHYNVSYYTEWFKSRMKVSPMEYIQTLRLKEAKKLLLDTSYTILQIALLVGYKHNSSLTRVFKAYEKITPAEYRERNPKNR